MKFGIAAITALLLLVIADETDAFAPQFLNSNSHQQRSRSDHGVSLNMAAEESKRSKRKAALKVCMFFETLLKRIQSS